MKKTMIFVVAIMILVFVGCDTGMTSVVEDDVLGPAESVINMDDVVPASGSNMRSAGGNDTNTNGIKIAFRSSDIEFWASDGDFTNLISVKYVDPESDDYLTDATIDMNVSTEVELSDSYNNVIFMPNNVNFGDVYDIPAFVENAKYDVVRMDIGGGQIDYSKGVNQLTLGGGVESGNLDANSIILIDNTVLTETVYVPDFNIPTGNDFVDQFIADNEAEYWVNSAGIDMDGALFIPFNAIDFDGKGQIKKLKIRVKWDMDDIFSAIEDDVYTLNEDADGTPYDFDIEVEIN